MSAEYEADLPESMAGDERLRRVFDDHANDVLGLLSDEDEGASDGHSLIPVPQDIANAVEDYVRSELRDCARYSNRAPLDDSGVWSLRRLVERAYASGYDAGHLPGARGSRDARLRPDAQW